MNDIDIKVAEQFGASLAAVLDVLADAIVSRLKDRESGPRWLNGQQAAERCATTERAIAEARRRGEIPTRRRGRQYVFDVNDLDAWMTPAGQRPAAPVVERVLTEDELNDQSAEQMWRYRSNPEYIATQKKRDESRANANKCRGTRADGERCGQIVKDGREFCGRCKGKRA